MLNNLPNEDDRGHVAAHRALMAAYLERHADERDFPVYTSRSSAEEHRRAHAMLHAEHSLRDQVHPVSDDISSGSGSHVHDHIALHAAYNYRLAAADTPPPRGGPSGVTWTKIFADEFEGTSLDRNIWHSGWFGDGVLSGPVAPANETAAYAANHITVSGSQVHFRVAPNVNRRAVLGKIYPNIGSAITSDPNQGPATGYMSPGGDYYVEVSQQMPARVAGASAQPWPAFWQNPADWPTGFEIDIVEADGTDANAWHVHYPRSAGSVEQFQPAPGGTSVVPAATTGFHTYAALVQRPSSALPTGRVAFYYDGLWVGSVVPTLPLANHGRYFVLGVSSGGSGALTGDVYQHVDYVRAWTFQGVPRLFDTSMGVVVARESWTGGDGAPYPAQWTIGSQPGSTAQIRNNRGAIRNPASPFALGKSAYLSGSAAVTNCEIRGAIHFLQSSNQYVAVVLRSDGRVGYYPNKGYYLWMDPSAGHYEVGRFDAGQRRTLQYPAHAFVPGVACHFKYRASGNTLSAKVWNAGGNEPDSWDVAVTDTGVEITAGRVLTWQSSGAGGGQTVQFEDFVLTTS